MTADYESFVAGKLAHHVSTGLAGDHPMPSRAFPFQRDLVTWALRRGRAAIFANTGLGKTLMQCVWADVVASETGGRVLILAVGAELKASYYAQAVRNLREAATVKQGGLFDGVALAGD